MTYLPAALDALIDLPSRALEPTELETVALALTAREDLWRPLVDHDPDERRYGSLHVDDHIGVWVISWMPGHDTGWHDHAASQGAVAVAEGEIREERPEWADGTGISDVRPGECLSFRTAGVHRMSNRSDGPAVTIHVYSPPLNAMGVYVVEEDGAVRRRDVGWDERLDGAAAG